MQKAQTKSPSRGRHHQICSGLGRHRRAVRRAGSPLLPGTSCATPARRTKTHPLLRDDPANRPSGTRVAVPVRSRSHGGSGLVALFLRARALRGVAGQALLEAGLLLLLADALALPAL